MYRYTSTLRSWLLAALCSATALTLSCERKADSPQPVTQQSSGGVTLAQETANAQKVFEASSYTSALKEVGSDGKLVRQWQPQWNATFRAGGALCVPLSLAEKVSNAKHFLLIQNDVYSLALYVFPAGQSIELVENSAAFMNTFTGKLGLRRLDTKTSRLIIFDKGRVQAHAKSAGQNTKTATGVKPAAGAKTLGCVTNTTCYWEGRCGGPFGGQIMFLDITQGTAGTACEEPGELDCGWGWKCQWSTYRTQSEVVCEPDSDPTNPGPGPGDWNYPRLVDGWYKINVVKSGLLLDVYGAYTANGTNVIECIENGGDNQKWYVTYLGPDVVTGQEVYTFTPRSNYLYWQSQGASPMDQGLGVLPSGVPSNAIGAPVQIWAMSASPLPSSSPSPFNWRLTYVGLTNYTSQAKNKYTFSNQYSDWYLNVSGGGPFPAGQLIQFPLTGNEGNLNDQFTLTKLPL